MKKESFKVVHAVLTLLLILTYVACKKDSTEKMAAKAGEWSGTDISFIVGSNPLKISNLEFFYNPHATGPNCTFNYESGASFATVAEIKGKSFTAAINTFTISGTFLTDTTAEIVIDWTIYVSECDTNYTGISTYNASYHSL
jgi:hypothetical protein